MILKIKRYLEETNPLRLKPKEKIKTIKKLSRGESNVNYLLVTNSNKYLIRFDLTNKSSSKFKQEFNILRKIEKLNISSKPLFIDTSKKYFKENLMILSYIEGTSLDKLKKTQYFSQLNKMVLLFAKLHNVDLKLNNKFYSCKERIKQANSNIKKIKSQIDKDNSLHKLFGIYERNFKTLSKNYKPKLRFCHGDVCSPNILIHNKEFYLIDWESAGNYDPALELSYFFYELGYNNSQKAKFIKKYIKLTGDKTLNKRILFTDFFMAYSGYFDVLIACFNIAKNKGHKEYLDSANFDEYWDWSNYYLGLVSKLNLFGNVFEKELKADLNQLYNTLRN